MTTAADARQLGRNRVAGLVREVGFRILLIAIGVDRHTAPSFQPCRAKVLVLLIR